MDEPWTEGGAGPDERAHGHRCPECGAPRGPDHTPSCACTQQASDALRDARTAEAAATEAFDPLRIRPYVELAGDANTPNAPEPTTDRPDRHPTEPTTGAMTDATTGPTESMEASVRPETAVPPAPPVPQPADITMPLRRIEAPPTLPTPLAPPPDAPSAGDLSLFEGAAGEPYAEAFEAPEPPHRGRRRAALLGAAGAVVAVMAAAGFAGGLFSYETPSRDTAPPEDIRAAVPDTATSTASESSVTASASATPSAESASPSRSAGASPSSSPSASRSSASPSPSRSTEPTATATSAAATASLAPGNGGQGDVQVLRRGDRGPEVSELQQRLRQLYLYNDQIDGRFGGRLEDALRNYQWARGIRSDELGVYGAESRAKLEAETSEP
ncbi:peptidoglycan-binding protein [Streptomyces sp. NPDC059582]|uniref:peptidoglycan-binding domain-containing protein n=1 Tax=Streptomyces sp. NPDC059582 TaxID=3346875 RepID=UPI0036BBAC99